MTAERSPVLILCPGAPGLAGDPIARGREVWTPRAPLSPSRECPSAPLLPAARNHGVQVKSSWSLCGLGGGAVGMLGRGCEDGPPPELPRRPCHLSHPDCGLLPHRGEERPKGQRGVAKRGRTQDPGPGSAQPLHQLGDLGQELTAGV